MIQAHLTKLD